MTREEMTESIFGALRDTWKYQDETGSVRDLAHLGGILRGGCSAFLAGEFDPARDGVSLGLAFLSLAREALLAGQYAAIINDAAQGEA
jgi:hypothetical protein